jgi:hypothetical protein
VLAEHDVCLDLDNVTAIVKVVVLQVLQDFQFYTGLMLEFFLISNDLYGNNFTSIAVVYALKCLAKTALTEEVEHFKSETDMVVENYVVVAIIIVITVIVLLAWAALDLFVGGFYPDIVYFLVVH